MVKRKAVSDCCSEISQRENNFRNKQKLSDPKKKRWKKEILSRHQSVSATGSDMNTCAWNYRRQTGEILSERGVCVVRSCSVSSVRPAQVHCSSVFQRKHLNVMGTEVPASYGQWRICNSLKFFFIMIASILLVLLVGIRWKKQISSSFPILVFSF